MQSVPPLVPPPANFHLRFQLTSAESLSIPRAFRLLLCSLHHIAAWYFITNCYNLGAHGRRAAFSPGRVMTASTYTDRGRVGQACWSDGCVCHGPRVPALERGAGMTGEPFAQSFVAAWARADTAGYAEAGYADVGYAATARDAVAASARLRYVCGPRRSLRLCIWPA